MDPNEPLTYDLLTTTLAELEKDRSAYLGEMRAIRDELGGILSTFREFSKLSQLKLRELDDTNRELKEKVAKLEERVHYLELSRRPN